MDLVDCRGTHGLPCTIMVIIIGIILVQLKN